MNIRAIENNVIFQFVEDVTQTRFVNSSASGFIISSSDGNQAITPRWGKAISVGPDVMEIKVDDYILVEQGKWTTSFRVGERRYWKTDESKVIGVSDEPGNTY
jgi:co-chaperonin GroES (HSP10)